MHLKVSQKYFFHFIAFVLFTLLHAFAMKIGGALSTFSYTPSESHHKIFHLLQT